MGAENRDAIQREMQRIMQHMSEQGFDTLEAMNDYAQKHVVGKNLDAMQEEGTIERTAEDEAWEHLEDVMVMEREEALENIEKALEICPGMSEALKFKSQFTEDDEEAILLLQQVLKNEKEKLGDEFEELKGHFWGFHQTQIYMNAMVELA